jgi:alpha-N-arabinofuranosidase
MRSENGSSEPFAVRFWGVGNELWGCGGHFTPEDYADHYRRFTTKPPGYGVPLYMVACGPHGDDQDWTRRFFRQFKRANTTAIDGWSVHYYCGSAGGAVDFSEPQWYELLRKANSMEDIILGQWGVLGEFDPEHRIKLIIDEWGAWHPSGTEINPRHTFEQISTMRDAVIAALTLDTFNRHADKVFMANVAQMVNNLHSLFLADEERFVATPNFHVFEMYVPHYNAQAVQTEWDAPEVDGLPVLAGSASVKGKSVTLTVTNMHVTESIEARILLGEAQLRELRQTILSHSDIHAHNTFQQPAEITPETSEIVMKGDDLAFTFPPASVVRLDLIIL